MLFFWQLLLQIFDMLFDFFENVYIFAGRTCRSQTFELLLQIVDEMNDIFFAYLLAEANTKREGLRFFFL